MRMNELSRIMYSSKLRLQLHSGLRVDFSTMGGNGAIIMSREFSRALCQIALRPSWRQH